MHAYGKNQLFLNIYNKLAIYNWRKNIIKDQKLITKMQYYLQTYSMRIQSVYERVFCFNTQKNKSDEKIDNGIDTLHWTHKPLCNMKLIENR